jgi:diaminohydroxyphosphoribosylaminopyrimidine deaminase/5-amino-6-(5-phosphoribosylamino)uracil reductase
MRAEAVDEDEAMMHEAMAAAATARLHASPNPWVGCVIVPDSDEPAVIGATEPPGGPHAEAVALDLAGPSARGATVYVTLEPCSHTGRTGPCADALIDAGVSRVVIGIEDPDPHVAGQGIEALKRAGIETQVGVCADEISDQLAPYLKHRRTGRPWVVLKLAASMDGRTAAPDGSSQWITGPLARADAHRLRAESDAVLVGAGTVRADDPALTVRDAALRDSAVRDSALRDSAGNDPLRVVLGHAPESAKVHPALEVEGDLEDILDELGRRDVVQLLVEGGATVAAEFHRSGLVDRYVVYLAPVLFGGEDGRGLFSGPGAATINDVWRGRITDVEQLGADLRIELAKG